MTPSFETIQLLTERSEWVRALARTLVRDAASADDIAQEAVIEAMASAGSARRTGPGWLAGIVRNVAHGVGRRERRRARHEQSSGHRARESAPSAADAAAFVEQQRLLADAVLGLEAPFRDVVLLRFYEGKPQREIARELGIPVATVNSRLTRGLAKLRTRLDREHGGDRSAWVAALALITLPGPKAGVATIGSALVMNKKLIGAACVAALLVLGVGLVASGWVPGDAVGQPVPGAMAAAGSAPETAGSHQGEPLSREAVAPDVPAAPAPPPVGIDGPFVRVVDALTGEAVPQADVRKVDMSFYARLGQIANPITRAFEVGTQLALDDEARLPSAGFPPQVSLFARAEDRMGHLQLWRAGAGSDRPTELRLWPLQTVRVTVRDELDRPVQSVPVALRIKVPSGPSYPYSMESTDQSGMAQLQWYASVLEEGPGGRARIEAALAFAGGERASSVLTEQPDGQQDVTLRCPQVGRVRVRVTQHGEAVADGTQVFLGPFEEPEYALMMRRAETTQAGIAEFWPVGVGVRLRAGSWLMPASQIFKARSVGVPVANATTDLAIDIRARKIALHGRIVDARGEPRPRLECSGQVWFRGADQYTVAMKTGDDGRFEYAAVIDDQREDLRFDFTLPHTAAWYRVPFRLAPGASRHDLGDITVPESVPLVRGRVVDADRVPIPNASVSIVVRSDADSSGWRAVVTQPGLTGGLGDFELHADPPQQPALWITARLDGQLRHEPVPWRPGVDEIELVMERQIGVQGRLIAPAGVPLDRVEIAVWNESAGPANDNVGAGWVARRAASDGTFEVGGLRVGSHTVVLRLPSGERIATITGVRATGPDSTDPRLQHHDIGDAVMVLELTVRDEQGRVLDAEAVGIGEHDRPLTLGSTRQPLLLSRAVTAVRVGSSGYFSEEVGALSGRHEVTLQRGMAVDLHVDGVAAVPQDYQVRALLSPAGVDAVNGGPSRPNLVRVNPRTGGARPRVRAPGEHDVQVFLFDPRMSVEVNVEIDPAPRVLVSGPGASVRVQLDAAAVADSVRRMQPQRGR